MPSPAAVSFAAFCALLSVSSAAFAQTPSVPPVAPATIATAPATAPTVNAFTREILKDFDAWDTNHDGVLSEKEIDARLVDSGTTGEAAAAIGAIKMATRSGKFIIPPMTRDYFLSYAADYRTHRRTRKPATTPGEGATIANPETLIVPTATADPAKLVTTTGVTISAGKTSITTPAPTTAFPLYESAYTSGLRRINATPKDVFLPGKTLGLDSIHQGQIGDCYLLSVLGGMINRDPSSMNKLVKVEPDGSCDVTLPDGMTTHVAAVTDAEVAVSSGAAGTGRWLPLLEEAYGRFRIRMKNGTTADNPDDIGTDSSTKGGSVRTTIHNLTGHKVGTIGFRKKGESQQAPTIEYVTPRLPSVRRAVTEALAQNRLVAAGTGTALPLPPAINGKHAYAIIKFDPSTDMLTIWNPHNNNFTPKGEPGLTNGYPTKGGVFQMPLIEFAQVYPSISWEMPESDAPKTTPGSAVTTGTSTPATKSSASK